MSEWACRESHILKMSESRPVDTVKELSPFLWGGVQGVKTAECRSHTVTQHNQIAAKR